MIKSKGFTLIELMIVVAIIGIIAAIAYPSYQDSVRKSRRTDAKSSLLEAASLQERIYTQDNEYTDDLASLVVNADGQSSHEGYYTLSVDITSGCSAPGGCYTISATANGAQANDTACAVFSINNVGKKTSAPNTDCW